MDLNLVLFLLGWIACGVASWMVIFLKVQPRRIPLDLLLLIPLSILGPVILIVILSLVFAEVVVESPQEREVE